MTSPDVSIDIGQFLVQFAIQQSNQRQMQRNDAMYCDFIVKSQETQPHAINVPHQLFHYGDWTCDNVSCDRVNNVAVGEYCAFCFKGRNLQFDFEDDF